MPGIYSRVRNQSVSNPGSAAVFLDRDGVIVEETGYLCRVQDMRPVAGALYSIRRLNQAGLPVVMVSNQAGIGRGYYTWREFEDVQNALEAQLANIGAWLDGVWACAPAENHSHRKPNPGMLLDAAGALHLDLAKSWMVGDKLSDIAAGLSAGVRAAFHVETGYGQSARDSIRSQYPANERVMYCRDLREAVAEILAAA